MPAFKIYRLKESQFQHFRWAPHTPGAAQLKPKDYELGGMIDAPSVYAAWTELRDSGRELRIGDVLEAEDATLRICKYVGFEEAHWVLPEPKPAPELPDSPGSSTAV
ncbi:MAG: hypothetical protein ABSG25_14330 [Bryobacteraceae bacterium]|jgi:hypothetical protein